MTEDQREIRRKKRVIEYAEKNGNIKTACRRFGIARSTFYLWRDRYRESGDEGLTRRMRGSHNHQNKTRSPRKSHPRQKGPVSSDPDRGAPFLSIRLSPETRGNYPLKGSISLEMVGSDIGRSGKGPLPVMSRAFSAHPLGMQPVLEARWRLDGSRLPADL